MKVYYRDLCPAAIHPVSGEIMTGGAHPYIATELCDELRALGEAPEFERVYADTAFGYLHKPTGRFFSAGDLKSISCSRVLSAFPDRFEEVAG